MKRHIASILISLKCVEFSPLKPFRYASGLLGPIYCDNRRILSFTKEREEILGFFIDEIKKSGLTYDAVAGLAIGGVPHAAVIAHELKKSLIYVRGNPKEHGKGKQVEGAYAPGEKVILIEDLINQGKNLTEAVNGLRSERLEPLACFTIVDYEMIKTQKILQDLKVPLYSLTDFTNLSQMALEMGLVDRDGYELLQKWHEDPVQWQE